MIRLDKTRQDKMKKNIKQRKMRQQINTMVKIIHVTAKSRKKTEIALISVAV